MFNELKKTLLETDEAISAFKEFEYKAGLQVDSKLMKVKLINL